jgi:NTE family protein
MSIHPKIGLALGSGGFRGFAHIGVIQVLQENNIPIDYISGASIGALVAAFYSVNSDVAVLEDEILSGGARGKLPILFDFGFRGGFVSGGKFGEFLEKMLGRKNFNDCKIPLEIVATDLISGQAQALKQGKLSLAVRASSSVPLVFQPVKYRGKLLVDGGLSNPVPVNLLKTMGANKVIAVNLYHQHEFVDKSFNMPTVALRASRIAVHNLAKYSLLEADVVMNPDTSAHMQDNKYKKYFQPLVAKNLIDIGRREAKHCLPAIKKMLEH